MKEKEAGTYRGQAHLDKTYKFHKRNAVPHTSIRNGRNKAFIATSMQLCAYYTRENAVGRIVNLKEFTR